MKKQQLMEELSNYMADGYSEEHDDNAEAIMPPRPQRCNLCDSLKGIIESIAAGEEEISRLIGAEADKLKSTVKCPVELVRANKSIGDVLDGLIIFEGFTILKLKAACACKEHENAKKY